MQGEAEDGAAAEVQLAGEAAAEDNVGEVVALVVVCLDDGVEELDFGGDDGVVGGQVASDLAEDVNGFLTAAVGDEPSVLEGGGLMAIFSPHVTLLVERGRCLQTE